MALTRIRKTAGLKSIANTVGIIALLYIFPDSGPSTMVFSLVRLVCPQIVPLGAGLLGDDETNFKAGSEVGRVEGEEFASSNQGIKPSEFELEAILNTRYSSQASAWREGYRAGFQEDSTNT
jgi:hypothetical protein